MPPKSADKRPVSIRVPRNRSTGDAPLPGVHGTRQTSQTDDDQEIDADSSSGEETEISQGSPDLLFEGSDTDRDTAFKKLRTRDLLRRIARYEGLANYHYRKYRQQNARRNTLKSILEKKEMRGSPSRD